MIAVNPIKVKMYVAPVGEKGICKDCLNSLRKYINHLQSEDIKLMDKSTHWQPSDIMDDGNIGIVNGLGEIIVGWGSGLSWEDADKICSAHNNEVNNRRKACQEQLKSAKKRLKK